MTTTTCTTGSPAPFRGVRHTLAYAGVRLFVLVLTALTPLSVLLLLHRRVLNMEAVMSLVPSMEPLIQRVGVLEWHWWYLLELMAVLELGFYLHYRHTLNRLRSFSPFPVSAVELSKEDRRRVFSRALQPIPNPRHFWELWFLHTVCFDELHWDNIAEFFAWAFFLRDYEELKRGVTDGSDEDPKSREDYLEIRDMVGRMERWTCHRFPKGRNPRAKCMRLNFDPISPRYRPFLYYLSACSLYLTHWLGFERHYARKGRSLLGVWTPGDTRRSNTTKVGYWFRKSTPNPSTSGEAPPPLVFIHGIGVGLFGYMNFLRELSQAAKEASRSLYCVELPHVSTLLYPVFGPVAEDVPTPEEMVDALDRMLQRHTPDQKAVFMGHSMGSAVVAWMIRLRPHLLDRVVLVDPICFLLHLPDLAYNFVYRKPANFVEYILWWFASRELYISWTLGKCFVWFHNVLFLEDIPSDLAVDVVLGGSDAIVPSGAIREYLVEQGNAMESLPENAAIPANDSIRTAPLSSKTNNLHLHYFPTRNHAEFLFAPNMKKLILELMLADAPRENACAQQEQVWESVVEGSRLCKEASALAQKTRRLRATPKSPRPFSFARI